MFARNRINVSHARQTHHMKNSCDVRKLYFCMANKIQKEKKRQNRVRHKGTQLFLFIIIRSNAYI